MHPLGYVRTLNSRCTLMWTSCTQIRPLRELLRGMAPFGAVHTVHVHVHHVQLHVHLVLPHVHYVLTYIHTYILNVHHVQPTNWQGVGGRSPLDTPSRWWRCTCGRCGTAGCLLRARVCGFRRFKPACWNAWAPS